MPSAHRLSDARDKPVSKDQVLRFVERRFALADHNHDGLLDQNELALLAYSIACAFRKAQTEYRVSFAESLLNDRSVL